MIITRTPFRISFAGGGTDLKAYYTKEAGKVISTSIDKYIYVVVKRQIGIVEHKYRINWRKVEFKDSIDEIEHPIVREALRLFGIDFPIEITTFTDIPGDIFMTHIFVLLMPGSWKIPFEHGEMVYKYI